LKYQYLVQRGHIFKSRNLGNINRLFFFKFGTHGLFSLKKQRFEFIYLRGLKRLIKRRYLRIKTQFKKKKFWLFLTPNLLLSKKSTNARMGAGVGSFVRLAINLKSYYSFLEFDKYSTI
jgi:ribosomal protein L16/L10AE